MTLITLITRLVVLGPTHTNDHKHAIYLVHSISEIDYYLLILVLHSIS